MNEFYTSRWKESTKRNFQVDIMPCLLTEPTARLLDVFRPNTQHEFLEAGAVVISFFFFLFGKRF
jgi:hypothetical protein